MNPNSSLGELRVGCVQYLNSRPLIHGLKGVTLAHPSELARSLRSGTLDAALVPIFEVLRAPGDYRVVDGVGIVSRGAVYSVFVAHEAPVESLDAVIADPASLTSVHLFQVLAWSVLQRKIPLVSAGGAGQGGATTGRLLIGNQAIAYRISHPEASVSYWDLGEQWTRWTGLPFVYAAWVLRRDLPGAFEVAEAFRQLARAGVASIDSIVAGQTEFPPELAKRYLTEQIHFELGAAERAGMLRFSAELEQRGLLEAKRPPVEFI